MTGTKSTRKRRPTKPEKPRPDFPLFAHASGQWAKKFKGRMYYFGKWDHPDAAEKLWLKKQDVLLSSTDRSQPPEHLRHLLKFKAPSGGNWTLTVGELCEKSVSSRRRRMDSGELSEHTYFDHKATAGRVEAFLGSKILVHDLTPDRFADFRAFLAKGVALKTLEGTIAESRAIFNHANKNGLIEIPLAKIWGTEFDKPTKTRLKKEKNGKPPKELTADEIKRLLAKSDPTMKAMIFLAVNCGFGNSDVANLKTRHINDGFVELPRSKTGTVRRCPLWPETQAAINAVLDSKKGVCVVEDVINALDPKTNDLLFVTNRGNPFLPRTKESKSGKATYVDPVGGKFNRTKNAAKVTGCGKTFYALRHAFQTIGDESRDFVAVKFIMGHDDSSISDNYRGRISDDRLRGVTDTVHHWLFPGK